MTSNFRKQRKNESNSVPVPEGHRAVRFPGRGNPYELDPFELVRSLEARVMAKLEQIFEEVRRLEGLETHEAKRRAIRIRQVLGMLGIGKSTLYARLNPKSESYDPKMPPPFRLGASARSPSVWWEHEVLEFLESSATACRKH